MKMDFIAKTYSDAISFASEIVQDSHNGEWVFFRGHSDSKYRMIPSISRVPGIKCETELIQRAHNIFPQVFPIFTKENAIDVLSRMQHYGIPTRMLDITTDINVALYFACRNKAQCEGEVLILKKSQFRPKSECLINGVYEVGLPEVVDNYLWLNEWAYLCCNGNVQGREDFLRRPMNEAIREDCEKPFVVRTPRPLERQKSQSCWHIFFPKLDHESDGIEKECVRMRIPADVKYKIEECLNRIGVSEMSLFPENIEDHCRNLVEEAKRQNH